MADETEVQVPETEACEVGKSCRCRGCLWVVGGVLLFLVVVALLLPAQCTCREAARRMQCCKNLKQIMLAMHNYREKYGCFPPAYTVDKRGRRMHSWRALLLEFLDQEELYKKYDFSHPWNSPDNLAVAKLLKGIGPFHCPTEDTPTPLDTSYVMLVGPQAFSDGPTGRKPDEIIDGSANTIAVVEMSPSGIGWTEPRDLEIAEMNFKINNPEHTGIHSCHPNGANVAFADGHVMYLANDSADENILKALMTINSKEDVSKFNP